jgi:long-chain acyl-CoA synthetase
MAIADAADEEHSPHFFDLDRICRFPTTTASSLLSTMASRLTQKEDGKVIPDYILDNCARHPNKIFLTQPLGGDVNNIQNWTFAEFLSESKKMASHIESLALPVPSQIAIMSKNCAWWLMADLAIMMTGHISVPVYPTLTAETTKYTLEHSEAKLDEKPWKEMKNGIPENMKCIAFPMYPEGVTYDKWADCVKGEEIEEVKKRTEEEMATIIYTSGSTGV